MEFLNGFGLSATLRDGEGIVIQHNRLHSALIHSDQCEYEICTEIEKGNPFPEADMGRYAKTNKDTPTNASAECDGIDGCSEGGRQ